MPLDSDELDRKLEAAHRRLDDTEKDTHLLKSQVDDIRVELKALEKGQNNQNATLAGLAVDVKYLRSRAEEKEKNGDDKKSNIAVALSVLAMLGLAILQLVERI